MVLKTHMLEDELPSKLPEDTWLFATSRSNSSSSKLRNAYSDWRSKGYDIRYIQDLSLASEREHLIALEYQSIFGLTNKNMQDIIEFLKYWDVLRRCCGMQMSRHWRAHLMSRDKVLGGGVDSSKVSFCQGHNISSIENDFMATKLYQELKVRPKLRPMLSPSNVDDVLDGSYCSRYNDFVRNTGAQFNEPLPTDLSPGDGAVPGDQEASFLPRLEYTGPGVWEDSSLVDLAASESTDGNVALKMFSNDDHSATGPSFRQGDKISFVIYGFGKTNIDRGLIVWFEVRTIFAKSYGR